MDLIHDGIDAICCRKEKAKKITKKGLSLSLVSNVHQWLESTKVLCDDAACAALAQLNDEPAISRHKSA